MAADIHIDRRLAHETTSVTEAGAALQTLEGAAGACCFEAGLTGLDRSVEVATHGSHRLLLTCPDRTGIIAAVTGFLAARGANILEADQHSDPDAGLFAMRLEFEGGAIDAVKRDFASEVARPLDMSWKLTPADARPRIAILCSREDHCLFDLLLRIRAGSSRRRWWRSSRRPTSTPSKSRRSDSPIATCPWSRTE